MEKDNQEEQKQEEQLNLVSEIINHLGQREFELINLKARFKKGADNDSINKGPNR